jgi:DtxR family Mn-dependent transcriptional regulator
MVHSQTVENYLKAIFQAQIALGQPNALVPMGQLAAALHVVPGTATTMVKALSDSGLAHYEPYAGVRLTRSGEKLAALVLRRHRLIELFLVKVMGMSWSEVHDEAENLEHAVSDRLIDLIDQMLGRPEVDPHGDPIPTAELELAEDDDRPLSELARGGAAVIRRVPDGDPGLLRYLAELGFVPDERVVMLAHAPFDGPLTVEVAGERHAISRELAQRIRIGAGA